MRLLLKTQTRLLLLQRPLFPHGVLSTLMSEVFIWRSLHSWYWNLQMSLLSSIRPSWVALSLRFSMASTLHRSSSTGLKQDTKQKEKPVWTPRATLIWHLGSQSVLLDVSFHGTSLKFCWRTKLRLRLRPVVLLCWNRRRKHLFRYVISSIAHHTVLHWQRNIDIEDRSALPKGWHSTWCSELFVWIW